MQLYLKQRTGGGSGVSVMEENNSFLLENVNIL